MFMIGFAYYKVHKGHFVKFVYFLESMYQEVLGGILTALVPYFTNFKSLMTMPSRTWHLSGISNRQKKLSVFVRREKFKTKYRFPNQRSY